MAMPPIPQQEKPRAKCLRSEPGDPEGGQRPGSQSMQQEVAGCLNVPPFDLSLQRMSEEGLLSSPLWPVLVNRMEESGVGALESTFVLVRPVQLTERRATSSR